MPNLPEPIHTFGPRATNTSKSEGRLKIGLKKRSRTRKRRRVLKDILDGKGGPGLRKPKY